MCLAAKHAICLYPAFSHAVVTVVAFRISNIAATDVFEATVLGTLKQTYSERYS